MLPVVFNVKEVADNGVVLPVVTILMQIISWSVVLGETFSVLACIVVEDTKVIGIAGTT